MFRLQRVSILEDLRGGVLPDGTQRIGRGEVGAQLPLRLPSLPSETSHPPLSSRLCDCLGATPEVTWLRALG